MALAYRPPGTSVNEVITPHVSPLLAAPANVCLVGLAQGSQVRTDQFVISGTTAVALPGLPQGSTLSEVISVKDALDPSKGAADGSGYSLTTDYTVTLASGTITRVQAGKIADGTLINVTYRYVAPDYYEPYRLFNLGDVESRYGSGLNADGSVNSPLSLAASIAFENGADSVIVQPLFKRATPGNPDTAAGQPDATAGAALTTWQDTLYNLRAIEDINVIVPVVGQSQANVTDAALLAIFQAVQDHVAYMKNTHQYIVGLFAEDSSTNSAMATISTVRGHAAALQGRYGGALNEQLALINTTKFTRTLPNGVVGTFGGQYVAVALAGMLCSRPVSDPLTRDVISGFLSVDDRRDENKKNIDAAAGLMVVENYRGSVRVRHGITLDTTATARRELSVVRAKHRMIESVRDTLENQIIGKIIADANSPFVVRSAVVGVLEELARARDLVDYSAVDVRLKSLDPTTMQVRFSYRPAFPVNYIDIEFSLDLTAATITPIT